MQPMFQRIPEATLKTFEQTAQNELIDRLPYLASIEPEAKHVIATKCKRICGWREGRIVFDIGDPSDQVFVNVGGIVELSSKSRGAIWHYGAGTVLGDDAILTSAPHEYSAIARTPCHLLVFGDWYKSLAQKYPGVQRNIYHQAQLHRNALADSYDKLLRVGKLGRVVLALLNIAQAVERPQIVMDGSTCFPFTVWWETQEQIGDLLCVSRPKVREALEILRKSGVLEFRACGRDRIELPLTLREHCTQGLERLLTTL